MGSLQPFHDRNVIVLGSPFRPGKRATIFFWNMRHIGHRGKTGFETYMQRHRQSSVSSQMSACLAVSTTCESIKEAGKEPRKETPYSSDLVRDDVYYRKDRRGSRTAAASIGRSSISTYLFSIAPRWIAGHADRLQHFVLELRLNINTSTGYGGTVPKSSSYFTVMACEEKVCGCRPPPHGLWTR